MCILSVQWSRPWIVTVDLVKLTEWIVYVEVFLIVANYGDPMPATSGLADRTLMQDPNRYGNTLVQEVAKNLLCSVLPELRLEAQ